MKEGMSNKMKPVYCLDCFKMDMQAIKNAVLDKNVVAIEVFPKQRDLVDGSNTYHLWTWADMKDIPNLKGMPRYH